ncbi:MAG: thioredoxin domain-containing protein [Sedimentisphaerales bacterium]|nr:thioredoxin domain-containing protein [Sedimentisphaerales bacterium]
MAVENTTVQHKHRNRLAGESSPYLLQHAENSVDWYPWGKEAFELAKKLDKPIFLSIGYSTCHWCHVMAHESFENEALAAIMNEHFVCVKVDREQRPDIDAVYMDAVQAMTGSGGWPLSVFLTADGKPFCGGTYFPPRDSFGRPGFDRLLLAVAESWKNKRDQLLNSADAITEEIAAQIRQEDRPELSVKVLKAAKSNLQSIFDAAHGGFGAAPKFPQPSNLSLLLRYWHRTREKEALDMVKATLDAMAKGGIYDHLGGGFHRYSTDARWLVPHFEKMLYDQALLSRVYIQAYQVAKDQKYAIIVKDIFDYVLRDMTDPQGGFYTAEDADSEGQEGTFYVWDPEETKKVLGAKDARIFDAYYGVSSGGNFEHRKSILHITRSIQQVAKELETNPNKVNRVLSQARAKLLAHRSQRPRPHRDDKIITGWNGLMISSMACGGAVLDEPKYVDAAKKAADFVLSSLRQGGRLKRFYRNGKAIEAAFLDDYAFLILGLLDLYEATFDPKWLVDARELTLQMIDIFGEEDGAAFYLTAKDAEHLIIRSKPAYDGAVPSGNSVAALALLRLGLLTMDDKITARAEKLIESFSAKLSQSPISLSAMLNALDLRIGPAQEIIIAGDSDQPETRDMLKLIRSRFLPNAVLLLHPSGQAAEEIEEVVPFLKGQLPMGGKVTAFGCENYVCRKPVNEVKALEDVLDGMTRN